MNSSRRLRDRGIEVLRLLTGRNIDEIINRTVEVFNVESFVSGEIDRKKFEL